MTVDQTALTDLMQSWFTLIFVPFLRIAPMISVMPGFGETTLSTRVKLVIAIVLSIVAAPMIEHDRPIQSMNDLTALAVSEACVGLVLGLGLRLFILALQTAGAIAANVTSLAQVVGNPVADPLPAISFILVISGLALAMALGFHVYALNLVLLSYTLFPIGHMPSASLIGSWGTQQVAHAFQLAFILAGPFAVASLIYNLALGAINKAMPTLMVAFVGAPVIMFAAIGILFLSAQIMLSQWSVALMRFTLDPTAPLP